MILVLLGKSASGKSTLSKELENLGFERIVTYTSRPRRQGEVDGVDYHFLTPEEFDRRKENGFFAETADYDATFGKCSYGSSVESYRQVEAAVSRKLAELVSFPGESAKLVPISKESTPLVPRNQVVVLSPGAAKNVRSCLKEENDILFVYLCAPDEVRKHRLESRGDEREEIERRMAADKEDFRNVYFDIAYPVVDQNGNEISPPLLARQLVDDMEKIQCEKNLMEELEL